MTIQTIKDSSLTYKQTKDYAVKLSNGYHQPSKVFQKTGPNTWTEVWARTLPSYDTFAFRILKVGGYNEFRGLQVGIGNPIGEAVDHWSEYYNPLGNNILRMGTYYNRGGLVVIDVSTGSSEAGAFSNRMRVDFGPPGVNRSYITSHATLQNMTDDAQTGAFPHQYQRISFFDAALHDFIVQCLNMQVNVRYTFLR